jgi:hypothetical protein
MPHQGPAHRRGADAKEFVLMSDQTVTAQTATDSETTSGKTGGVCRHDTLRFHERSVGAPGLVRHYRGRWMVGPISGGIRSTICVGNLERAAINIDEFPVQLVLAIQAMNQSSSN